MKKYFLFIILFGHIHELFSQIITITNQESNKPIEGVYLISENPKAFVITNAVGQADISALRGAQQIQLRSLGYKTYNKSFTELETLNFVLSIEPSNLSLDEVVVSATRWRQTTNTIPSKIISITPSEIALQNPQTTADMLGLSGKVFIQKSQQGGGSPMIRGFATNRLIYTVDGVRMNTAIFRGGNIQNVINLDPFSMESTEVLFGPGSVIYGSDAIGGVMSFQTLLPELSLTDKPLIKGKWVSRYSSANNEKTAHFDINLAWKKWAFVSSFSRWDYDNLKQGSNGPEDYIKDYYVERQDTLDVVVKQTDPLLQIPSAYEQYNIMQKIRFKPNQKWDFEYGFHYSETSPYGRYDRHNRVRNGTARYAEWNYGPQKWMMNNLSITHSVKNVFYDQMSLRIAQQSFEESRIDRSLNNTERNIQTENVEAYSVNLDMTKSVGSKNTLFYGAEYVFNDVVSKGELYDIETGVSQIGPSRYPQSNWSSLGLYINDEFKISEQFSLQSGARYNSYKMNANFSNNLDFYPFPFTTAKVNNSALTGSVGGVYHPSEKWVIKANMGTAFRSPNVDDVGKIFDSEPGAIVIPNPYLKAEYAYNADFGFAKVFGKTAKLDITTYYTILQNALVRRDFQLNGADSILYDGIMSKVQSIQNAAVANVYGIQLGLEVNLLRGLSFSNDLNYQMGEEELDNGSTSPAKHAAPLFGMSSLNYKRNKFNVNLYCYYQGEKSFGELPEEEQAKDEIYAKDANGNNYAPSWYTLNFKTSYDLNTFLSFNAGVENITDQRYRPYSSGISAAGRNFVFSMKVVF